MLARIDRYLKNPEEILYYLNSRGLFPFISDERFLMHKFKNLMGYKMDLKNPRTFNEKIQWLKLYDRNPSYTTMVDKYEAKKYVGNLIGEEYIIPTIGIWKSFREIDFDVLPTQFVLKCTHDSGGILLCKDKSYFDIKSAEKRFDKLLHRNFYYSTKEWPYKNVKPRIVAEKYLTNESGEELNDYKFMCFNGQVRCCFVCSDRRSHDGLKVTFFDKSWKRMSFERHYPSSNKSIPKPLQFEKMIYLAEKLSRKIPFIRVDFYEVHGNIYFGELTFYPGGGFEEFKPFIWDRKLGDWLELRK